LKTAGGVAILRLFHEAGVGCNWFWWTMGSSAQWQSLFKYAFQYLTATKGLNNVLWVAPLCGSPDAAFNPGTAYIDFGGADDYVAAGDYEPLTSLFQKAQATFPNMMGALHENGSIPDPDQLRGDGHEVAVLQCLGEPLLPGAVQPHRPSAGRLLEPLRHHARQVTQLQVTRASARAAPLASTFAEALTSCKTRSAASSWRNGFEAARQTDTLRTPKPVLARRK
jgi:hypothetical protein